MIGRAGRAVPGPEPREQNVDPLTVKRRLTCILAADAVGYSQQVGLDEENTIRVLSAHRAVIDGIIIFHGGRIISTAGDSVLAEFSSVVEAVRCAVEIQEALKTRNDTLPDESRMHFRVGVNLGDVVVKDNDLLGDGVNVAARLETLAEPGGICISSSVYDQITGKLDLGFQDIGEQALKNISRPIRVYRVSGTAAPQRSAPPAQRKRKSLPWGIGAAVVVGIAAIAAWQTGWLRFGAADRGSPTNTAAPIAAPTATAPAPSSATPGTASSAPPTQADADTQRLRADAQALKKQTEAELARARSDADVVRAASRLRAQAEADAARIRSEAEAAAARAKSDAEAATRTVETRAAKAASAARNADKPSDTAPVAAVAPAVMDKTARAPATAAADGARYDGTWSVTVVCAPAEGASAYKLELVAQVKDNFLRGEQGADGKPGWLRLQGVIQPDGSATLDAQGLTGDPKYNLKGVAQGLPYAYVVAAHFDANRGTGRRLELRACDLRFAKQ
jgi:class 3 adenylate cyclase